MGEADTEGLMLAGRTDLFLIAGVKNEAFLTPALFEAHVQKEPCIIRTAFFGLHSRFYCFATDARGVAERATENWWKCVTIAEKVGTGNYAFMFDTSDGMR